MGAERDRAAGFGRMEDGLLQAGEWYRWGPYVSERQWGTVREDYSADGNAWDYLPHDHARSRAYRWGEDGLAGFCDIHQRLCLSLALWNGRDPILKERAFGLTGPQGNHGEDVKEYWWYLDALPSHAWNRWRYHYPQEAFPYQDLVRERLLRIVETPPVPRVAGKGVQVPPVLLHVLAVVALRTGEPERPLLQDRVAPVPQRQAQAQPLVDVAEAGQPVLAPPVRAGPRVIVGQVIPRVAVGAVVLSDRAPLPLTDIWPPPVPLPGLQQP